VVPSVTLGTGDINSPVFGAGRSGGRTVFNLGCAYVGDSLLAILMRTNSEMPLAKHPKAGINIQNHQTDPPGAYLLTSREITVNATPIVMDRIASSILGSRCRFLLREDRSDRCN